MPWPVTLGLYRILMELINNTIKHSGATTIEIGLAAMENGFFSCTYTDNGHGFNTDANDGGLGLKNIQGRVNALKGAIQMGTAPAGGFVAAMQIPV
jgi:signal transduction histidine kinase